MQWLCQLFELSVSHYRLDIDKDEDGNTQLLQIFETRDEP